MRRLFLAFLLCAASPLLAQTSAPAPTKPLRVALRGEPPFVMGAGGAVSGFAVDLWKSVAAEGGWPFEFRSFPDIESAMDAVAKGDADVLVGNPSITSAREKRVEFSQPFYRSGLQIMVSENRGHVARAFERLADPQHLEVLAIVAIGVVLATVAVAAFERRHNPEFPKTHGAAIAEAFYYVMGLLLGKSTYKGFAGVLGRLVLVGWMLASLFVVSYVTSVITSAMTVDILRGRINGPQDLPDKLVGVISETTSEEYARQRNLDYVAYPTIQAASADLVKGRVQALVGDAPVLQYYDFTNPRLPIHEVGPVFDPVNYGFALPINSPLRSTMNQALLHLAETGFLDELGTRYFGSSFQK